MLLTRGSHGATPLHRQVYESVLALIEDGALRPGDRLPPTRQLAASAGVHRSTVVRAYEELRALGVVESTQGSYTTVRHRSRLKGAAVARNDGARQAPCVDWLRAANRRALLAREFGPLAAPTPAPDGVVDFDRLTADPDLAPVDELRACLRRAVAREGVSAFDYAEPAGWAPLREIVARRLRAHGIAVTRDEVLITAGAQHALDLVMRLLVTAGDRVAVEAPTYGAAHALLRLHGAKPVEITMRHDGMDLDALERCLRRAKPKLVYTIPTFHNPTGTTTNQAHRERLLALCERARVPLVEDGFEEEMKYFGKAALPIKSMDVSGIVLYIGTLSKVVFPGLRIGWIAASPEVIATLASMQHASSLAVNTVAQIVAARFCDGGEFDAHLRRIHRVYRRRMQHMLRSLDERLPPEIVRTRPVGGYTIWLTLPESAQDETAWLRRIAAAGVRVGPGSRFFAKPPKRVHFRLSFACADEEQIRDGCRRLGRALEGALRTEQARGLADAR
ncbi:MAG: PLP-dependent aminotransferase family protein [Labilithrix sp.]|nr:PLP-dependent aminotransferase family protein [Labilithrix sp.]